MKIKTSELTGAALDWAVAVALGFNPQHSNNVGGLSIAEPYSSQDKSIWQPSTSWAQCGPLLKSGLISLVYEPVDDWQKDGKWGAWFRYDGTEFWSDCPMVSVCRAVVASNMGDEVEVPDELGGLS